MSLKHLAACISVCLLVTAVSARAQELSELSLPPNGMNQKAEVSQWIGLVKVTIAYHSPNVHGPAGRDRTGHIWGELVKYGMFDDGFGPSKAAPWRAGSNETTTISFSHDVTIAGQAVRAGTYGLFLELQPTGPWTWILSTQTGWGAYQYEPKSPTSGWRGATRRSATRGTRSRTGRSRSRTSRRPRRSTCRCTSRR